MKRIIFLVIIGLVFGALGLFSGQWIRGLFSSGPETPSTEQTQKTDSAASADAVVGLGRIEPAGGIIDVGAMMGDRLGKLLVHEGDHVEAGAALAELESRAMRQLEVEAAADQLQNAEARLGVEQKMAEVKIEAARLNLKKAETANLGLAAQQQKVKLLEESLEQSKKDKERIDSLSKELVSDQERERQSLLMQKAESELESGRAMLDQLVQTNQLAVEAAKLELKTAEEALKQLPLTIPIESLRIRHKMAEAQYARTLLTAPCRGTVLKIHVRPGESITNKPVLQMADLDRMVVVAEVYENEVKNLEVGQSASISSKAFPSPYDQQGLRGTVVQIGRMISSPVLKSIDPFAPADRHVVEVRVELDEEGNRQAASLSNLQVDVRFPKEDTKTGE